MEPSVIIIGTIVGILTVFAGVSFIYIVIKYSHYSDEDCKEMEKEMHLNHLRKQMEKEANRG